MWVVERRGKLRLAQKPGAEVRVVGELGRDHLQRYVPVETCVTSEEDGPHSASAEDGLDRVGPELVADVHGHVRSR